MNLAATGKQTPVTLAGLSANTVHRLELKLEGYQNGIFPSITVFPDSVVSVFHRFSRYKHALTIVSRPEGADIFLDGVAMGMTPRSFTAVTQGQHVIELKKDGFHSVRMTISIPAPGNMVEYDLSSLPPGKLVFQIIPWADARCTTNTLLLVSRAISMQPSTALFSAWIGRLLA